MSFSKVVSLFKVIKPAKYFCSSYGKMNPVNVVSFAFLVFQSRVILAKEVLTRQREISCKN